MNSPRLILDTTHWDGLSAEHAAERLSMAVRAGVFDVMVAPSTPVRVDRFVDNPAVAIVEDFEQARSVTFRRTILCFPHREQETRGALRRATGSPISRVLMDDESLSRAEAASARLAADAIPSGVPVGVRYKRPPNASSLTWLQRIKLRPSCAMVPCDPLTLRDPEWRPSLSALQAAGVDLIGYDPFMTRSWLTGIRTGCPGVMSTALGVCSDVSVDCIDDEVVRWARRGGPTPGGLPRAFPVALRAREGEPELDALDRLARIVTELPPECGIEGWLVWQAIDSRTAILLSERVDGPRHRPSRHATLEGLRKRLPPVASKVAAAPRRPRRAGTGASTARDVRDARRTLDAELEVRGGWRAILGEPGPVVVKPNLVMAARPPTTTDPFLLEAVLSSLVRDGFDDVTVADSGIVRTPHDTAGAGALLGLPDICARVGARFVPIVDPSDTVRVRIDGRRISDVEVLRPFCEARYLVNLAPLKYHTMAGWTAAAKNLVGTTGWRTRTHLHRLYCPDNRIPFLEAIAEIATAVTPDFNIVDARVAALEDHLCGRPHPLRAMVFGSDLVAVEVAAREVIAVAVPSLAAEPWSTVADHLRLRQSGSATEP